ncbi:haloacid dehalogenase-like hydrolase [Candidatus Pacearchaeota archaeon]|nr:haloacid dehalogenase-like hydrolase [Candidatus Pacearchaeota archaeon]
MINVIIQNIQEYEKKKRQFKKDGIEKVHVLSDFDKTLTKAFYHGEKASSLISRLRNGNYLSLEYARKAHELFDFYHPIEIDSSISIEEKKEKMYKWWRKHKELLIESGLDKQTIESCVKEMIKTGIPDFRKGVEDFLQLLHKCKIPLVILSASLEDLIQEFLKQKKVFYENIHVIGNEFSYDKQGRVCAIKRIIHVFNKNETTLEHLPIYDKLLNT